MTESKTPLTSEKMSEPTPEVSSTSKATLKQTTQKNDTKAVGAKPANTKQKPPSKSPNKISKLAIVAIIIAIAAPAGHYYWQQLQHQTLVQSLTQKFKDENSATLSRYKTQMQQALSNQEQVLSNKLQQISAQIQQTSQGKITALENTVAKLEQGIKNRQPSDWLLHEAEYLIRISARTLWLEHDSRAAIGLLKDADARLTELNDPAFLPVRETIHQDINTLTRMPTLETDDVIVTLIAMNKQVTDLSLAIIDLGKENTATDIALSDNINDWQSNLAKTWQKFLNDFIRVRQRVGTVEALISPEQQANLKQNLNLKIQLAIWAATERKGELYQKTLTDIQQWLNEFFDMEDNANQLFYNALTALQNKQVAYDYPSELSSLTAIRATLRNQQIQPLQSIQENDNTPEEKATDATNDATQDPKSEGNL